ncbi:MAG TPA: hypothetical protein VK911_05905 [Vicinamibacterales bacterium]|nr:hypothetical protein [Vicinamibacterales bacterium]
MPLVEPPEVLLRELYELVEALNRRVIHMERNGEAAVARDAEELRNKALKRIAELEARARQT